MTHNIFRIQDDDSVMCTFYRIDFIEYMFAGKILLDCNKMSTLKTNFRLKSIDETNKYLLKEVKHDELIKKEAQKDIQKLKLR